MEQEKLRLISGMCGASLLPMKTTSCRYERTGPSISPKSCGCSGQISNRCVYYISIYIYIYCDIHKLQSRWCTCKCTYTHACICACTHTHVSVHLLILAERNGF